MSTFSGKMNEYAMISLDRFDGINLQSTAYFLSHCHSDHMVGLSSQDFHDRLKKNDPLIKIFCSKISKSLLINDPSHTHLKPFLISLPIDESISIEVPNKITTKSSSSSSDDVKTDENLMEKVNYDHVTVTLIPAGHCPGSVMFLFEGKEKTALYTGDFRFSTGSVQRMTSLHCGQDVKKIESLYIDTTFCSPQSLHIATRKQSSVALIELTKNWISRSKNHIVFLNCSANFGYEYLFVELYKHLKVKIHVSKNKLMKYAGVLEIMQSVTDDNSTQIHACSLRMNNRNSVLSLPCGFVSNKIIRILKVKLSTMWFSQHLTINDVVVGDVENGHCRLNFSTHSSLSEICDVVNYLKPENIYANVVPDYTTHEKVIEILMDYCEEINRKNSQSPTNNLCLLGSLKRNQKIDSSQDSNLMFDVELFSPAKKSKAETQSDTQESGVTVSSQSPKWNFQCSPDPEDVTPSRDAACKTPELIDLTDSDATPDSFTPNVNSSPMIKIVNEEKLNVKRNLSFEL